MSGGFVFVFRVDGNAECGFGHLVRCLALATELHSYADRVLFVTRDSSSFAREMIERHSYECVLIPSAASLAEDLQCLCAVVRTLQHEGDMPVVILDGYSFLLDYQRGVLGTGAFLTYIDDLANGPQVAHLILNQNIWALPECYPDIPAHARLLLGPRYALLRREFLEARSLRKRTQPLVASQVLVTFGAGDAQDVTGRVAKWLAELDIPAQFVLLVGPDYRYLRALSDWVEERSGKFTVVSAPKNVALLMAEADVAIGGAGSTCWELCFMGIPSLVVILAENQARTARGLEATGISQNLGWFTSLTAEHLGGTLKALLENQICRQAMSDCAQKMVDGLGAQRVVSAMIEPESGVKRDCFTT